MIGCVLLMYIGARLDAPWWYYALLGVYAVAQIVKLTLRTAEVTRNGK